MHDLKDLKWSAAPLMSFDSALQDAETGILGDSKHNLIRVPLSYLSGDKRKVIWADAVWKGALGSVVPAALQPFGSTALIQKGKKPCRNPAGWWGFYLQPVMYVPKKQCFNISTIKKRLMSEFVSSVSSIIADQSGDDASNQPVVYSSWWWLVRDIDIPPLGWKYVELTHLLLSTFTK